MLCGCVLSASVHASGRASCQHNILQTDDGIHRTLENDVVEATDELLRF